MLLFCIKSVDKCGECGIIETGSDTSMDVLTRKSKPDSYVEPMPKKQFRNIKKLFSGMAVLFSKMMKPIYI